MIKHLYNLLYYFQEYPGLDTCGIVEDGLKSIVKYGMLKPGKYLRDNWGRWHLLPLTENDLIYPQIHKGNSVHPRMFSIIPEYPDEPFDSKSNLWINLGYGIELIVDQEGNPVRLENYASCPVFIKDKMYTPNELTTCLQYRLTEIEPSL